uniref:non-specific serine/threonine protein kinase n=1 Tax=Oryza glumipatula TaxID=40148 RepID=A0A0E0BNG7_9ORYZ
MDAPFLTTSLAVLATLFLLAVPLSAATHDILPLKSSLFVEEYETNILQSSDGTFSCGFYNITNAYNITSAFTLSIWYSNSADKAIVWSANRGRPVHSRRSEITLRKDGNIVLTDYDGTVVWQTDDTLLPTQRILATTKLVSTTGLQVPGHYSFRFSDQSILSLIYDDTNVSGVYWPDPDYQYYENNRNLYNSTRIGSLDDYGEFFSSDLAKHQARVASDRSLGIKRRLTLDYDGNLRLYSLNNSDGTWTISWIAQPQTCMTHGLCGPYGICHYSPTPRCSCPPGYKMRNPGNWTQGCKPIVEIACDGKQNVTFLQLRNTDFWGSDQQRIEKVPWEVCWNTCISDCTCKGFQYQEGNGTCYPKSFLFNGRTFPTPFVRTMYIKLPSSLDVSKKPIPQSSIHDYTPSGLDCDHVNTITTEAVRNMNKIGGEEPKWFYFYGFIGVFFIVENDGGVKLKCFNLECSFVQTSKKHAIGAKYDKFSTDDGPAVWWVSLMDEPIGYFHESAFTAPFIKSFHNEMGGHVLDRRPGGRHTLTPMGSGMYPSDGLQNAACIHAYLAIAYTGADQVDDPVNTIVTHPKCYDIRQGRWP